MTPKDAEYLKQLDASIENRIRKIERLKTLEEVRLAALSATVQEFKDGAYVYKIDAFKFDRLLKELLISCE